MRRRKHRPDFGPHVERRVLQLAAFAVALLMVCMAVHYAREAAGAVGGAMQAFGNVMRQWSAQEGDAARNSHR